MRASGFAGVVVLFEVVVMRYRGKARGGWCRGCEGDVLMLREGLLFTQGREFRVVAVVLSVATGGFEVFV